MATFRAVSMLLPGGVEVIDDPQAPGGKVVGFMQTSEVIAETTLDAPAAGIAVRDRGENCKGPPRMEVTVDGVDRFGGPIDNSAWADTVIPVALDAGIHSVSISFPNDYYEGPPCNRNLFVEGVHFLAKLPAPAADGGADGG